MIDIYTEIEDFFPFVMHSYKRKVGQNCGRSQLNATTKSYKKSLDAGLNFTPTLQYYIVLFYTQICSRITMLPLASLHFLLSSVILIKRLDLTPFDWPTVHERKSEKRERKREFATRLAAFSSTRWAELVQLS